MARERRQPRHAPGSSTPGTARWVAGSSGRPPSADPGAEGAEDRRRVARATGTRARRRRGEIVDSPIAAWGAVVARGQTRALHETGGSAEARLGSRTLWREDRAEVGDGDGVGVGARERTPASRPIGLLPIVGRIFPGPVAAKVPEIIFLFWVVKVLTTAGGEATSDYLRIYGNVKGGAVEVGLFLLGLVLQFGTRRYRAFAYWFLAYAIAIFGTGVSDFLHLDVGIPYAGTSLLWAVVLGVIFVKWKRREGTLSIHSISTQRREGYYWATVFATFALGTALGDFTAASLHLGYLASGILFGVLILLPPLAWRWTRLGSIAAFWMSYVLTRPLGASFADYISKPHSLSGIAFGDGPTAALFAIVAFVCVSYLALRRPDIQDPHELERWEPEMQDLPSADRDPLC